MWWPYLGQVRTSKSKFQVDRHRKKQKHFQLAMHVTKRDKGAIGYQADPNLTL